MWYVDDDYDYFAHSSAIAFGQFPSYKKEFFTIMKEGPQSPIGTGLLASPFVFVFSLLDRAGGSAITGIRTHDNIVGSWSQFGFQVSSIFYFVTACYILFLGISRLVSPANASTAVILMMICQGLPLFVFRRPFFSHCSEFFLQSVLMYLFLDFSARKQRPKVLTAAFFLSALFYLTRPNDIAFALLWPLLMMDYSKGTVHALLRSIPGAFLFAGAVLVFQIWPDAANHMHPYAWAGQYLTTPMSVTSFFQRIVHIFLGTDWGLVYTAPFLLISLGGLFLLERPVLKRFIWLLLPMAVNFYVIISWGSQGGWYGYRYFVVSAIPVMALPLALILEWASKKIRGWVILLAILLSLPPVFSMLAFEGCSYFNLQVVPVDFNRSDWTNPELQANIWAVLIHAPAAFGIIIAKGILTMIMSARGIIEPLTWITWLRIIIILLIPWLVYSMTVIRRKILK